MKKVYNEIRLAKGKPDDIVIDNVDLHLEDMNGNSWWLGAYSRKQGDFKKDVRTSFWIYSKSKITVTVQDNLMKTKIIKG